MDKRKIIEELKKEKKKFYKEVARRLKKCPGVDISKIERLAKDNETIVVPGRVIGNSKMTKKVKIYAYAFSSVAEKNIIASGSSALGMEEFLKNKELGRIII